MTRNKRRRTLCEPGAAVVLCRRTLFAAVPSAERQRELLKVVDQLVRDAGVLAGRQRQQPGFRFS